MRSIRLVFLLAAALPSPALSKAWQGVTPGQSTRAEVVARFGEPSTQGKLGDRSALVYKGEQALPGTRQAQFFTREDGIILEITVFPAQPLDKESVEGTYGKGSHRTFTDDFRPVWVYRTLGVSVFFGKEGTVDAITFRAPEKASPSSSSVPDIPGDGPANASPGGAQRGSSAGPAAARPAGSLPSTASGAPPKAPGSPAAPPRG